MLATLIPAMNVCFIKDTIHSIYSTNKSPNCENKFRYTRLKYKSCDGMLTCMTAV